jgi:hypothetical protein
VTTVEHIVDLVQYGSYTVVIQAGTGPTPVLVADVAGPFPYTPIIGVIFGLLGLGLLHWAFGKLLVSKREALKLTETGTTDKGKAKEEGGVTLLAFFGFDKKIRKAEKAAAASNTALNESLLAGETRDASAPATVAAAKPRFAWRIRSIDT